MKIPDWASERIAKNVLILHGIAIVLFVEDFHCSFKQHYLINVNCRLCRLAGVPIGRKSSVCLICMKYRIIILIIIQC